MNCIISILNIIKEANRMGQKAVKMFTTNDMLIINQSISAYFRQGSYLPVLQETAPKCLKFLITENAGKIFPNHIRIVVHVSVFIIKYLLTA